MANEPDATDPTPIALHEVPETLAEMEASYATLADLDAAFPTLTDLEPNRT
jgi:hypothetical protein